METNFFMNIIVPLSKIWSRGNFMWLEKSPLLQIFCEAFMADVPSPVEKAPSADALIGKFEIGPNDQKYIYMLDTMPRQPVWHPLMPENIMVHKETKTFSGFEIINNFRPADRWNYFYFFFTIFWGMIFHLENFWLACPKLIWNQIIMLLNTIYPETKDRKNKTQLLQAYLAMWERLMGIEFDIKAYDQYGRHEHYYRNIVARSELKPDESTERPVLFKNAVAFLKNRLRQEIEALLQA